MSVFLLWWEDLWITSRREEAVRAGELTERCERAELSDTTDGRVGELYCEPVLLPLVGEGWSMLGSEVRSKGGGRSGGGGKEGEGGGKSSRGAGVT